MAFLQRIHAHDRALYEELLLPVHGSRIVLHLTLALTHMGGATAAVTFAVLPFLLGARWHGLGIHALLVLVVSHVAAQVVKRSVGRPRPSHGQVAARFIEAPDRFSFPSGHATASLAIALAYATAMPQLALPLLLTALAIGASRVALGVHYPGDVAAGQCIALATHLCLLHGAVR